jgi:hypothetical protein
VKYRVGSRVKLVSYKWSDRKSNPRWGGRYGNILGTITSINESGSWYCIEWDNGHSNDAYLDDDVSNYKLEMIEEILK